jgi:hypothetical protein
MVAGGARIIIADMDGRNFPASHSNDMLIFNTSTACNVFIGVGSEGGESVSTATNYLSVGPLITTVGNDLDVTSTITTSNLTITGALAMPDASITTQFLASHAITTDKIAMSNITVDKMASNAVITSTITDSNVTAQKLAANAVTTIAILDASVTAQKLASNAVTTSAILDANVTSNKLAPNAVTAAKMATDAITTVAILDANVTAAKLAANAVTTSAILDANVTTNKLAPNAVTAAKMATDAITTVAILDANVTAQKLASNAVTTVAINALAVTSAKIAMSNITVDKMASNAVITSTITDSNVTAQKLAANAVTTIAILDASVTAQKLATNAVTTVALANNSVTSEKLSLSLNTSNIATSNLTVVNNLATTSITGTALNLDGTILFRKNANNTYLANSTTVTGITYSNITASNLYSFTMSNTSDAFIGGTLTSGPINATGAVTANTVALTSDDRVKDNEQVITGALQTICKLRPEIYDKYTTMYANANAANTGEVPLRESGLVAQEIYYNTPELRHLVIIPQDATPSQEAPVIPEDPNTDPDYSSWGTTPASVNYMGLIPYLVKAVQELKEKNDALEARVATIGA